jgi:hypothetical protein
MVVSDLSLNPSAKVSTRPHVKPRSAPRQMLPEDFAALANRYLRWTVHFAPLVIVSLFVLDFTLTQRYLFNHFTVTDPMLSTGLLAAAFALVLLRMTLEMIPSTLATLWDRDIIASTTAVHGKDASEAESEADLLANYKGYVAEFAGWMNSRYSWVCGAVVAGLIGYSFAYRGVSWSWLVGVLGHPTADRWLILSGIVLQIAVAYVIGLLVWRMVVITVFVHRLGQLFDLDVQVLHPDRCGGLRPLGDLCFMNALTVSVGGIYLAGWLLAINQQMAIADGYGQWEEFFRQLLLVISVLAWAAFLDPLLTIHSEMRKSAIRKHKDLDALSRRIDEKNAQLYKQAEGMSDKARKDGLAELEFLRDTYTRNSSIPVWPFDTALSLKFVVTQALPLLSLTGVGTQTIDLVKELFGFR